MHTLLMNEKGKMK